MEENIKFKMRDLNGGLEFEFTAHMGEKMAKVSWMEENVEHASWYIRKTVQEYLDSGIWVRVKS